MNIGCPKLHWSVVIIYKLFCLPDMLRQKWYSKQLDQRLADSWRREAARATKYTLDK